MKKFVLVVLVLGFLVYWGSAHGIYIWYESQIEDAIVNYYEEKGHYPRRLKDLTRETYTVDDVEKKFILDIPPAPSGKKWDYNPRITDKVKLIEIES